MVQYCPECGSLQVNGLSCFEQLGQVLAWESQDVDLWDVHFLTVASYNLQHPSQFTDEAIAGLKASFTDYLDGKTTIEQILQKIRAAYNGSQRVKKAEDQRVVQPRSWSITISDVYIPDQPHGAAERVKTWADTIKQEW